jgi:hypothetical protein
MPDEEHVPVSASDALRSARTAEDEMRRRARSIRPSIAIVGLASGFVTVATILPGPWDSIVALAALVAIIFTAIFSERLVQRSGSRRLVAQPGQHIAGRLILVVLMVLVPVIGILVGTYTDYTWVVVALAIALPLVMFLVPRQWEKNQHLTVAGG